MGIAPAPGSNLATVVEPPTSPHVHWATKTGAELGAEIEERFKRFEFALRTRDLTRMVQALTTYFGADEVGHESYHINREGKQGQIRYVIDNEFRTVVRNKLTIATATPGGFQPVPKNSDADTQRGTMLARGLLDYEFDELGVDAKCKAAAEMSEVLSWSYVDVGWNDDAGPSAGETPTLGEAAPAPEGAPPEMPPGPRPMTGTVAEAAGDVEVREMMPSDVAYDYDARGEVQFLILRHWPNKYDLAAQVAKRGDPASLELAESIRSYRYDGQADEISWQLRGWGGLTSSVSKAQNDEVPLFELRHLPTPGCPGGRWARMLTPSLMLDEGPGRYQDPDGNGDLGCYKMDAGRRFGTPRSYASSHDMLGLQKVVDTLTSIIHSNSAALGLNVIAMPESPTGVRIEDVREGLVAAYYSGGVENLPQVLKLGGTDPSIPEFLKEARASMAAKEGLNPQSMGRDTREMSGSLAALLDTSTQRAVSDTGDAFRELRRKVATGILWRFQQFAGTARNLSLKVGKARRALLGEFSGKDLSGIARVGLEEIPAAMRGIAGRVQGLELAGNLQKVGIPPEVTFSVLETGKYEAQFEGPMAEILTIREENERLLQGEALEVPPQVDPATGQPLPPMPGAPPPRATAVFTDNPLKHIMEHRVVGASPAARGNPQIMANLRMHIQAHMPFLTAHMSGDPIMFALHGPPPMSPPVATGDAGNAGKPGQGGSGDQHAALPKGGDAASPAGAPQQPTNPSTGEKWSPSGAAS
jgi:hypothetical protein